MVTDQHGAEDCRAAMTMPDDNVVFAPAFQIEQALEQQFARSPARGLAIQSIPNMRLEIELAVFALNKPPQLRLKLASLLPPLFPRFRPARKSTVNCDDRSHAFPQRVPRKYLRSIQFWRDFDGRVAARVPGS
jgi:hypothetical protein